MTKAMFSHDTEVRVFELHPAHGRKGAHAALPVLNLLCWQDGKTCFAHCLELDIAADGPTEEAAMKALAELIVDQIGFSVKHGTELYHPAPREYWDKLEEIRANHLKRRLHDNPPRTSREVLDGLQPAYA